MKLTRMWLESWAYRLLGVSPADSVEHVLIGVAYYRSRNYPYKVQELVDSLVDYPAIVEVLAEIARKEDPEIYAKVNWSTPRRR